jgi:hypothetical protein
MEIDWKVRLRNIMVDKVKMEDEIRFGASKKMGGKSPV